MTHGEPEGVGHLNKERDALNVMQNHMQGFLRQRLVMWSIRWAIGMPIAFAIPAIWGVWPWLPQAAAVVAVISLVAILITWWVMNRKFRNTQRSADRLEQVLREEAEEG